MAVDQERLSDALAKPLVTAKERKGGHHQETGSRRSYDLWRSEQADHRDDNQPSYSMELAERQALVRLALSQISEEYRTALVLKEIEGLKYEEIAEIVGCPIGTVRSRIHRARTELREKLRLLLKHN